MRSWWSAVPPGSPTPASPRPCGRPRNAWTKCATTRSWPRPGRNSTCSTDALEAEAEASGDFTGTFVTAVTPGILATTLLRNPDNPAYARDEDYVFALARELRQEYEHIVSRGHILQLDAPDLALERQILFVDRPLEEFQERMEVHVAALNEALENIPRDRVRMHVCWGNWDGPHCDDVDLEAILPIIYKAEVGGLSLACANPAARP